MNADGTGTRRLTSSKLDDDGPSWSPDGTRVVFSREGALFAVGPAGGAARRIGRGLGRVADPAWSPDGKRIAYVYRRPGYTTREVYVVNADGTGARRLTSLDQVVAGPAWSPDGKRIAFQSGTQAGHDEIYTVGVDGAAPRRITTSGADAIDPAWTPDGRLSYARDGAIWVDDGGDETRLTSGDDNDSSPAWRPAQGK
jgi:TolB protein